MSASIKVISVKEYSPSRIGDLIDSAIFQEIIGSLQNIIDFVYALSNS